MSWIGSALVAHAVEKNKEEIISAEDLLVIESDRLKWYRVTQLHQLGVTVRFINLARSIEAVMKEVINGKTSSHSITSSATSIHHIVYIPTSLFDKRRVNDTELLASQLDGFHNLLFYLTLHPETRLALVVPSVESLLLPTRQSLWVKAFERLLSSRERLANVTIIRVGRVCGAWSDYPQYEVIADDCCWYISDLVKKLYHKMTQRKEEEEEEWCIRWKTDQCPKDYNSCTQTPPELRVKQVMEWRRSYEEYLSLQTRNVTVGHYLMFGSHYRWGEKAPPNRMSYIAEWYLSAMKHTSSSIVIFHDSLRPGFQERLISYSPERTELVQVGSLNKRISHDQRFYMTYNYLLDHPEIHLLVTTDIRDTVFKSDPMRAMGMIGDYLFIDNDSPLYFRVHDLKWLKQMTETCYDSALPFIEETLFMYGCYDNGFIGGSRHVMLSVLSRMILFLDSADISSVCDQVTANIVAHGFFYESLYAGYPLTSGFMTGIAGPQGVCVKHKPRVIKSAG